MVFEGHTGTSRRAAAAAVCQEVGLPLLAVDVEALRLEATRSSAELLPKLVEMLVLRQRLLGAGLCLTGLESLWEKDGHLWPEARRLISRLVASSRPLPASHSLTVPSKPPLASNCPSALSATPKTSPLCPCNVASSRPLAVSHSRTVPS